MIQDGCGHFWWAVDGPLNPWTLLVTEWYPNLPRAILFWRASHMGSEDFFSRPNDPGIDPLVPPAPPTSGGGCGGTTGSPWIGWARRGLASALPGPAETRSVATGPSGELGPATCGHRASPRPAAQTLPQTARSNHFGLTSCPHRD